MVTTRPRAPEGDVANGVAGDSLLTGVVRVFAAGERLLVDRAALVRIDSREMLETAATRVGLAAAGLVFLFTAWLALLATAIIAFDGVPLAARIGGAALAQLLIGAALLVAARRAKGGASDAT